MENTQVKKRNANMELLRMISMLMVVMLHGLGKGELLLNLSVDGGVNATIAWLLESLSLGAVNIFILISGYYLIDSKFKIGRLIELVAELLFYSVLSFAVSMAFGIETYQEWDIYHLLHVVLPVHMKLYWFMTCYICIYMLLPLISAGVKNIEKKQFGTIIICLLIFECAFKTILPVRITEDEFGYNVFWFLIVFLIGAYYKLYGFKYVNNFTKGICIYLIGAFLIFLENTAIDFISVRFGHLEELEGVSTEYNHIFVLMSAIGIFAAFLRKNPMKDGIAKIVTVLSPMALGVYLIHENLAFRYAWPKWFGLNRAMGLNPVIFVLLVLGAVLSVYAAGTLVDFVRIKIFSFVKGLFLKREKHEA